MLARAPRFKPPDDKLIEQTAHDIDLMSLNLYLQAITTFYTLQSIIHHIPLFFAQRQPYELATFKWIVDGKEPAKKTNWERWWSWYASGALASMSKRRPAIVMEGADYTFYERFRGTDVSSEGIDLKLLLADLRFSSAIEPKLELVDIVVNATRRALIGNLGEAGWGKIPTLMVHRPEPYIQFLMLIEGQDPVRRPSYAGLVNQFFARGGRPMVAPRFLRKLETSRGNPTND